MKGASSCGLILAIALVFAPLAEAAGQPVRCRVGEDLTAKDLAKTDRDFYATIVARYGADSRQAQLFVPRRQLGRAAARAAGLGDAPRVARNATGEGAAPLDASELERLTDWAGAMGAEAAAVAQGGGQRLAQTTGQSTTKVPTYFHVITGNGGAGGLSDAVIQSQITALNAGFRPVGFEFELAQINRVSNDAWFNFAYSDEAKMKPATVQGTAATLNVWTVNLAINQGTLGFATLPGRYKKKPKLDGVVIDYRTLPGVENGWPFNLGGTLTHETGHWMGLLHTFQGGCVEKASGGDRVADTPAERQANMDGCDKSLDTCPGTSGGFIGNDPVSNFMDYSPDSCYERFSSGQAARMAAQWIAYRLGK